MRTSSPASPGSSLWRWRAIAVGVVSTLFILTAIPALRAHIGGRDIPLPLAIGAANFLVVPIILSIVDRVLVRYASSILSRMMVGTVVAALVGGTMSSLMWSGLIPHVARKFHDADRPTESVLGTFGVGAILSVLVVGAWSLAAIFPRVLEQEKVRALQVANLELEAAQLRAEGELARLRGQLEPHFLLNTLNLISGLVGMDVDKARRTIVNLGDLLRDALETHGECQSIDDEIQWLERYCEILVARHGPRLTFEWDVDQMARNACLPRLLLQPLVENAIVHGALRAAGSGVVSVRVRMPTSERVEISVEDNGPGLAESTRAGAVGVANVRRRLELTRPDAIFALESDATGTLAFLSLPYTIHIPGEGKR
ncbi:histidine kinase [Pendulispora rubella]|uniref:Histidine kinase n=1 Tax=Pendulispora rubella TaxID=2741070 RepID=A0ABZ2LBV3_9BACT